jgi:hypothetical protein
MQYFGIGKTAMYRLRLSAPPVYGRRTSLMFLTKVDIAALILHSFSAGVMGLLLVYAGIIGDGSTLAHLLSLLLLLVNSGTVLRVLRRGARRFQRFV